MRGGVYLITNLFDGKQYVGSATRSIRSRWSEHLRLFRKKKHSNYLMSRAVHHCGVEALSFSVIENCPPEKCIEREQHWMDTLKPEYNIREKAGNPGFGRKQAAEERQARSARNSGSGNPFFGRRHSVETITHFKLVKKGKVTPDEVKKKLSAASTIAQSSPEYRAQMSATIKAWWAAGRPSKNKQLTAH